MENRTIYLITEYFPSGSKDKSEHAFVQHEIRHLEKEFNKVIIAPTQVIDQINKIDGFELDLNLATLLRTNKTTIVYNALQNIYFYKEIWQKGMFFWNMKRLKRLLFASGRSRISKKWAKNIMGNVDSQDNKLLFYTFWTNEITLGIALNNSDVVARAHGHDLYENYYGYLPLYKFIIEKLKRQYLVSEPAVKYLTDKYPEFSKKFKKFHLGVEKAQSLTPFSTDKKIRIVSCSYLLKRKRVDLVFKGLESFVLKYEKPIIWTHLGNGPELKNINELAESRKNRFLEWELKGFMKNEDILHYYQDNPIDIFILTSEEEGGVPVVLQEAQAHGIPIIGTKIGGIPEIVNENVGVLLSSNPTAEEIADAIHYIIEDKERLIKMRENSIENWNENFNEKKNYELFSSELFELMNSTK